LFVVRQNSTAASILDIENYELLLGPEDCDEKHLVPKATIDDLDVKVTFGKEAASCSIAAKQLLASPTTSNQVAVISSYAAPLLEGCGSIKKGDLRVIGETEDVLFISAFASESVSESNRKLLTDCLIAMKDQPEMLVAMETKTGFQNYSPIAPKEEAAKKKPLTR
jgi:ABC-type phosphate/phosphonate transport system substrate-binding protein